MIKCKICESEILGEKLKDHSVKCKDVTELKEKLFVFVNRMEDCAEKASSMKNSLETYAAKQKKFHKKLPRKNSFGGNDPSSPSSNVESWSSLSSIKESQENETLCSEDEKTGDRTVRNSPAGTFGEPTKKMSDEEYEKFIVEAKKGVFALKKIIAYANKVNEWTNENDLDFDIKSELEVIYADILDAKVAEFLKNFMTDLDKYIELKKTYLKECEKLAEVSYDQCFKANKSKFQATKSISFNKQKRGFNFKAPQPNPSQFKEDSMHKNKDIESPQTKKRTVPNLKPLVEFASPFTDKRVTSKQPSQFLTGLASGIKSPTIGGLLQNNSNHVSNRSIFSNGNRNTGSSTGLDALREKLKNAAHPSPSTEKKESTATGLSEHQSTLAAYKERAKNKKSRNTAANIKEMVGSGSPIKEASAWQENDRGFGESAAGDSRQNIRKNPKSKLKRTNSMDMFRNLHKDEDFTIKFPSLLEKNSNNTNINLNDQQQGISSPEERDSPQRQLKPSKKKSSEDSPFGESPSLKGYYSDSCFKPHKKKLTAPAHPQVTMEDFEPIKFIGKGAYGTVWLVRKKGMGDEYAMKIVDWSDRAAQNRMSALKHESDIYKMLDGDYVVKAIWTFHHENYICFVTEFMIGGDFNILLDQLGRLEEDQARFYFAELVLAIESLHHLGIVHRDLKPDNILMDAQGHIRLTDFGLSRTGFNKLRGNATPLNRRSSNASFSSETMDALKLTKRTSFFDSWTKDGCETKEHVEFKQKTNQETIFGFLKEENSVIHERKPLKQKKASQEDSSPVHLKNRMVGTPDYMAPEVINPKRINSDHYNEKCMDWWSMGIILYQLLVGVPPFCDTSVEGVFDNIENHRIEFPPIGYEEDCITPEAVDLIKRLLESDPSKRLGVNGAQEVKNHQFFKKFNWEGVKEREPPIIPFMKEDLTTTNCTSTGEIKDENDKSEIAFPFSTPISSKAGPTKRQIKQIDLDDMQFRRLDVLDKLNQETYANFQRQDSLKRDKSGGKPTLV